MPEQLGYVTSQLFRRSVAEIIGQIRTVTFEQLPRHGALDQPVGLCAKPLACPMSDCSSEARLQQSPKLVQHNASPIFQSCQVDQRAAVSRGTRADISLFKQAEAYRQGPCARHPRQLWGPIPIHLAYELCH